MHKVLFFLAGLMGFVGKLNMLTPRLGLVTMRWMRG